MSTETKVASGGLALAATPVIPANGKVAASLDELSDMGFGGRTKLFAAVAAGDLPAYKLGRSTRVLISDAIDWLRRNPVTLKRQPSRPEAA